MNSSDNDSQDGVESTISFANLGLIYISITPKSGVKGKCKALWGNCRRAEAKPRRPEVGAPEIYYFINNPVALTCTSVHPCPPSMSTVSTLSTGCISWSIRSCFLSTSFPMGHRHPFFKACFGRDVRCTVLINAYMAAESNHYLQQSLDSPRTTQHKPVPLVETHYPSYPNPFLGQPPSPPP